MKTSLSWICTGTLCCLSWIFCARLIAQQAKEPPPEQGGVGIQVTVNAVLVPVVAVDRQGHAVGNLKKEDFQVFDRNKPRVISGFSIEKRAEVETRKMSSVATQNSSSVAQPAAAGRFIVFLFDDMHLEAGEFLRVKQIATKALSAALTDLDMGAVVSTSGSNSGLTRNRAKLQEAIANLKMQTLYRHVGRECPDVDYYQADLIENKHNYQAFEAAVQDALTCAHTDLRSAAEQMARTAARRAVEIGDQDVRVTLGTVKEFVRRLGALPARQRTLILVSPGFLTLTAEAMAEKSDILDLAARSDVTISALDARGLYTTELDASERGPSTMMSLQTGQESENHRDSMTLAEDVMSELADGTGGIYFHNSNDMEGGFQKLTAAPEYVYLLEISIGDVKQDGAYHQLKVKVDQDGLKLQARHGYSAPKAAKKKN